MAPSAFVSGFTTGFGSAFLQFLLERFASLGSLAWEELGLVWDVDDELRKLQRSFLKVQDLVDHASCNPLRFYGGSDGWALWFKDMRTLSYDADSLLDRISLHLSIYCAQHLVNSNQEHQVRPMILSQVRQLNLPHEIANMQKKLDALAKEMDYLVMIENAKSDARNVYGRPSQLHPDALAVSCVMERTMVGRATEKQLVLGFLSNGCQDSNFSVFSLLGMVGVGKTAVASDVYTGSVGFDLRIWVSVSVDFDAVRITKAMIEYANLRACDLSDLGSLQRVLQGVLRHNKFLLVLDDYWSEKCDDWEVLSWPFRSGAQGSKVIVTTRSRKVASVVCSSGTCELDVLLEDDDCWELLKQSAVVNAGLLQNLESVGRQIAKRCRGIPLVATTLGHMLRSKPTEAEWCYVLKNETWAC